MRPWPAREFGAAAILLSLAVMNPRRGRVRSLLTSVVILSLSFEKRRSQDRGYILPHTVVPSRGSNPADRFLCRISYAHTFACRVGRLR